ncbi:unnamed protein product [Lupinus luteus]|uniref:Uncharacterized protein n=1 Tax=Lupinus luteus TaxID=3873 RepID=A0AAV1X5R2_LUPLU
MLIGIWLAVCRRGTSEGPQRKSPATPRTARILKTPGLDSNSVPSSPNPASKIPNHRSQKVAERRSPQSPKPEKKRPSRIEELESRIAQLQDELKRVKEQLNLSESKKRKAQQEAEEAKKQLLPMLKDLEDSRQQLMELSGSEEEQLQELHQVSHDQVRAWQSELDAVHKQHSMDSAALASAMNEIQKLKIQLQRVRESEATQCNNSESADFEIQDLRMELDGTLTLVEMLKNEVRDCKHSESRALEVLGKTQMQLVASNETLETLRLEGMEASEAYKSIALELEQSRDRVKSLEELVSKCQADLVNGANKDTSSPINDKGLPLENVENEEINQLKSELISAKSEVGQLKSALEVAEVRYIQSTLQIRSAYEQLEHTKSESSQRQAELYEELKRAGADIEELRATLMDKESHLQGISDENERLKSIINQNHPTEREHELLMEQKELDDDIAEYKARLLDRETELRYLIEENNTLKMEIEKVESEKNMITDEAVAWARAARAAEQEASIKLDYATEAADKSNRRVARLTEQLDSTQALNSELEAELRRLKVQADQCRKAAEAAAAMLFTGNNGKFLERTTSSLDSSHSSINGKMSPPYSKDMDYESPLKNTNMLKKIGVLWKKSHS